MKLIKDLGTSKTATGRRVRYGIYLCPSCNKETTINQYDVRRKRGTKVCYSCSQKANGTKHGLSSSRQHRIWTNIKQRTTNVKNKDYVNYGGRGVKMCDEWFTNFKSFYDWSMDNGYGETLTIDRIDNYKGYEPSNCRWITLEDQQKNKRK